MSKCIVHCHSAYIYQTTSGKEALSAIPEDYPAEHMYRHNCVQNGRRIYTTAIVRKAGDVVETERTIYHVKSWTNPDDLFQLASSF